MVRKSKIRVSARGKKIIAKHEGMRKFIVEVAITVPAGDLTKRSVKALVEDALYNYPRVLTAKVRKVDLD